MTCQCGQRREFDGDEARRYAQEHLQQIEVRAEGWEVLYRCPDTGTLG